MIAGAQMAIESICFRGVGNYPAAVVNGVQSSVSCRVESNFVSSPLIRTTFNRQVECSSWSGAGRIGDHLSCLNFGSNVSSRSMVVVAQSTVTDIPSLPKKPQDLFTVGDFMTGFDELYVASPNTTVDEALEILVEKQITGLPVVDALGKLVGVVSDYDLLALDSISGKRRDESSLFPAANSTWKAFKKIQSLLGKTHGKTVTVGELMSKAPLVVRDMTNIEDAARILLETKFRRLPVVDEAGKLVGLLTRGNVVKAALIMKRWNIKSPP